MFKKRKYLTLIVGGTFLILIYFSGIIGKLYAYSVCHASELSFWQSSNLVTQKRTEAFYMFSFDEPEHFLGTNSDKLKEIFLKEDPGIIYDHRIAEENPNFKRFFTGNNEACYWTMVITDQGRGVLYLYLPDSAGDLPF